MKHGILGKSGIAISPLVFGGNVLGWTADEAQSLRLLGVPPDLDVKTQILASQKLQAVEESF